MKPEMVAHAFNLSCLMGGNWENHSSKPAQAKKQKKLMNPTPNSTNKLGIVAHACDPSNREGEHRKMADQGQPWAKSETPSEK
jgi:hypothetical protein